MQVAFESLYGPWRVPGDGDVVYIYCKDCGILVESVEYSMFYLTPLEAYIGEC